jgi:hypothetical protein
LEEQEENGRKPITKVSTPKQNKRTIKATGANSNQNSSISKHKKSSKRKLKPPGLQQQSVHMVTSP